MDIKDDVSQVVSSSKCWELVEGGMSRVACRGSQVEGQGSQVEGRMSRVIGRG